MQLIHLKIFFLRPWFAYSLDNNDAQVKQGEIEPTLSITIEEGETKEQSKRGKIEPSRSITIEEDETKEQSKREKIEPSLSNTIEEDKTKEQSSQTSYSPLRIAASNGIVEIFDNMLKVYPQVIEEISKDEQNILHVAISHRQREIFKRIKKMKMIINRLASRIDNKGYTILHHVADISNYHRGNQPGPAFQLQQELKWFEVS